jgi:CheY-like chemotaxis protein
VTPDMAFECLLVSRDTNVVAIVNKLLDNLSISTNICVSSSNAMDQLAQGSADLVIVDCEDDSVELIGNIRKSRGWHKPTVVAVSPTGCPALGADVLLCKPVTPEACAKSLRAAYSRMIHDHRRHSRYAVMNTVRATDEGGRSLDVTVTDIGDGGVGLTAKQDFKSGDTLSFHVLLPGTARAIFIEARVQWTRQYGALGCEFLRIPPADLNILHGWLTSKSQIKKPAAKI